MFMSPELTIIVIKKGVLSHGHVLIGQVYVVPRAIIFINQLTASSNCDFFFKQPINHLY